MQTDFDNLSMQAEAIGMACRGGFHPEPRDEVPAFADGCPAATLVLFGFLGGRQWPAFAASAEYADGRPDALDRWSRRLIDGLGSRAGAAGLYPSHGPPWLPFQRWAKRAEPVHVSPLGILIHPDYGLWHAYRGALAFRVRLTVPELRHRPNPCSSCADKPCLDSCPVGAFKPQHYDHGACAAHVASIAGVDCLNSGCLARRSCPVGSAYRYGADQAAFHMAAFLR